MSTGHRNCTSKFISLYITSIIRNQIDMKPKDIILTIDAKFNIHTPYMKAWDARRKAIQKIFGSYEQSYASIYLLMETICQVMPGSVYRIQARNTNRFRSIFWAFGPCIEAWKFCRPVLSLDGTFLLGKYRGTLLAAVGQDADDGLLPFAFAIVESESTDSWTWFLQCLVDLIESVTIRRDLCIISDKHHGLVRGCREIMPWVTHVHCLRHLRENFKKFLRSKAVPDVEGLCQRMYNAGSTDNEETFSNLMQEIQIMKKEAYDWLVERDITKWSLLHDGGSRYGAMTTNSSESFNSVLKKARGLPIQGLIISIYYNLINAFQRRENNVAKWAREGITIFPPKYSQMLKTSEEIVRSFRRPRRINPHEFEVLDSGGRSFKVELEDDNTCSCSCRRASIYHIPCVHAIVALGSRRINYHNFVSSYYTIEMYKQTYQPEFHYIPDRDSWPGYDQNNGIIPLLPPNIRRRAGRPKTARIRNTMDENRPISGRKCGTCHNVGHNSATCPANPANRSERVRRQNRPPPC